MTGRGVPHADLRRTDAPIPFAWETRDPRGRAEELRGAGLEVRDGRVRVGPVVITLAGADDERLVPVHEPAGRGAGHRAGAPSDEPPDSRPGWVLLALAIATVDAERAAREFAIAGAEPRPRDPQLRARVLVGRGGPVAIALLEPDTEGRLTAMLARHGEGPVGLYLVRRDAVPVPGAAPGPFGPQRLLPLAGPPWAPALVEVQAAGRGRHPAGTIDR